VQRRYRIDWQTPAGALTVLEPRLDEVRPHVPALVAAYNDPRNATLLGHTAALTEADVLEHYETLLETGRPFLLLRDDAFSGDADLRGIERSLGRGICEFAFLIADPAAQGQGLGTRFATMVHAFAFAHLGLERIYASVVPANAASRRVFDKLGYGADDGRTARSFADPGDVTLSIDRGTFAREHAAAIEQIAFVAR
jgi:RimJ/RimL family protein N-acetyltransferase